MFIFKKSSNILNRQRTMARINTIKEDTRKINEETVAAAAIEAELEAPTTKSTTVRSKKVNTNNNNNEE